MSPAARGSTPSAPGGARVVSVEAPALDVFGRCPGLTAEPAIAWIGR